MVILNPPETGLDILVLISSRAIAAKAISSWQKPAGVASAMRYLVQKLYRQGMNRPGDRKPKSGAPGFGDIYAVAKSPHLAS
jgi:hypothetical protein